MEKVKEKLKKIRKDILLVGGLGIVTVFIGINYLAKNIKYDDSSNVTVIEEIKEEEEVKKEKDELAKMKSLIENDKEGYLQLVNRANHTKQQDIKSDLTIPKVNLVSYKKDEKNLVRKEVAKALENMCNDAKKEENINIFLNSGYRSADRQLEVYNAEIGNQGDEGKKYVALPGHSEHETGLAVDLTCKSIKFKLEERFENTDEGKWLLNNAYKYGFIVRYPKGKETETEYNYEPWHYRYVGTEISTYINKEKITLEELYRNIEK